MLIFRIFAQFILIRHVILIPEAGDDKDYELLLWRMIEEYAVAIVKGVIGQSEHLMALIPTDTGILTEALFFHDEVKAMPKEPFRPEISEQELVVHQDRK